MFRSARALAACSLLLSTCGGLAGGTIACTDDTRVNPAFPTVDEAGAGSDGGPGQVAEASVEPPVRIDDVIEPLRASSGVPGIAALVVRDGAVIAEGAAGVRKLGDPTPLTTSDTWYLGTTVETMTATLAALVVEEGKLSWTSTLGATLPDVMMHASYKDVTIEQLLGHRAGAPATLPMAVDQALRRPGAAPARREEAARTILAAGPAVAPGSTVLHSDAGYLIAALVLERATGAAWEDLMRARVFEPLGMSACRYEPLGTASTVSEPWGHALANGVLAPVAPGAALGWNAVFRTWAGDALALVEASQSPLFLALMWVAPARNVAFLVVANEADGIAASAVDDVVSQLIARFVPAATP
jgi:CubicO group peptidase (beta-lactamase class C family)